MKKGMFLDASGTSKMKKRGMFLSAGETNGINKKGMFFSTDALVALAIILLVVLVAYPKEESRVISSEIHSDILKTLSTLKVSESNNSFVKNLTNDGRISNSDNTLLEQIGEFYSTNETLARELAAEVLSDVSTSENVGLWYGNTLIFSINSTTYEDATEVETARFLVSGLNNESATGYSARALLSSSSRTDYFYFGGYVGDGNITQRIYYDGQIDSAKLEAAISDDFFVYVNGISAGSFSGSSDDFTPVIYNISIASFVPGENFVELRGNNLHLAGGFIKIVYRSELFNFTEERKYLPGINGLINLYDGIYVPENLSGMNGHLHINSNSTKFFFNLGNVSVYNATTNGEQTYDFSNAFMSSLFDYDEIEGENLPLRIGLENVSYAGITRDIDVFSVTDLSGSMCGACIGEDTGSCGNVIYDELLCLSCGGTCALTSMEDARVANKLFVDLILNNSGNRVGLVGYSSGASSSNFHDLSSNDVSLKAEVDSWSAVGSTCICCGINRAINYLAPESSLESYYNYDNNVNDQVNNYDGTINGNPTYGTGQMGNALNFDGNGDYVNNGDINLASDGSIVFWFRPNANFGSSSTTTQGLWGKYESNSRNAFIALRGSDMAGITGGATGAIQTKIERSGTTFLATTTTSWTAGNWYHFVYTWGDSTSRVYVNGVLENSIGTSRSLSQSGSDTIARTRFDTTHIASLKEFAGAMDEIRFYNRALTEREVDELYSPPEEKFESIVVMSDGEANVECSEQGTGDAKQDAIQAACEAYQLYGIVVNSIAFGSGADRNTLEDIAVCGNGSFFSTVDSEQLSSIYQQVADSIIADYQEQTLESSGDLSTILYPDSYVSFTYDFPSLQHGLIFTVEKDFTDNSSGEFYVPPDSRILSAWIASYSGPRWTYTTGINNNEFYNLGNYGDEFITLGDPYQLFVPTGLIIPGTNYVNITTAVSVSNSSVGSESNKIIYTTLKNVSAYSPISTSAEGCNWVIEFEDGRVINTSVPTDYSGSDICNYISSDFDGVFNENDALEMSVYSLLSQLDIDSDGRVDAFFDEGDLEISFDEVVGIPHTWSTEVQARRWI